MLNARRCLVTGNWCARARCLCVFGLSKVTLQWQFIIWVTSSRVGSTGYPDEKLTRASATAASWKSLALVDATMYNIFHWRFTLESAGGQDLPRGTEDKSDKLKEDYQDRKTGKRKLVCHKAVSFSCNFLWPELGSTRNLRLSYFWLRFLWWFLSFFWVLMHQRQSQPDEGMQTILAPDERKTEGRRDEENAPMRRRKCWFSRLLGFLPYFTRLSKKKKETHKKVQQKCSRVFFYRITPPFCFSLHPHATSHFTLILLFFPFPQWLFVLVPCVHAERICDMMWWCFQR